MTYNDVQNSVYNIITNKCLHVNNYRLPEEITNNQVLSYTFNMDSLDVVELIMDVEKHFDIIPDTEDEEQISTVGDIVRLVCKYKNIPVPDSGLSMSYQQLKNLFEERKLVANTVKPSKKFTLEKTDFAFKISDGNNAKKIDAKQIKEYETAQKLFNQLKELYNQNSRNA